MKHDEFAFFNQQLAAMLRDGIPLEGAIKQLCSGMQAGPLRKELEQLENDLARGTPLQEALATRKLPDFYKRMVVIGARGNDLPGMLTMIADYYYRANALWTRLKGLMVYPVLVIAVSLGLSVLISLLFNRMMSGFLSDWFGVWNGLRSGSGFANPEMVIALIWMSPVVLVVLALAVIVAVSVPAWRARLRWGLPAFREASLARLASAISLMLKNGVTLPEALSMAEMLEANGPGAVALAHWRMLVEAGHGKPVQWHGDSRPFPPLFFWLVQQGGEDVAAGFEKAADIYQSRASYRIEMALYGALPVSVLLLGLMVIWQAAPLMATFIRAMNMLGSYDS